ncbi:MAG: hypothetical protein IIC21_09945, partial [Chloroflexi bacterium]|nr:hypothetical protein [Chloroflexota bacterium]
MTDAHTERQAVPWKLRDVAYASLFVIVGTVVIGAIARLIGKSGDGSEPVNPLLLFLLQGLFLLAVWIIAVRVRGATWRSLGMRASRVRGGNLLVAP